MRKQPTSKLTLSLGFARQLIFGCLCSMSTLGQTQQATQMTNAASVKAAPAASAMLSYSKAIDQYHTGHLNEAVDSLKQTVLLDQSFADGYNSLCVLYDQLKRTKEALEACQRAVALDSNYATAFYNLGIIYGDMNRDQDAINALSKSIDLNPNDARAFYNLGRMYNLITTSALPVRN